MTKSRTQTLLEEAAERGSAVAAVQLDRRDARREREHRKPNATQVRAQVRDEKREAMAHSRDVSATGPEFREGYAARLLAQLSALDPDPVEEAWLNEAQAEYQAACDAFPWPDDRTPRDIQLQEQIDADQREVHEWLRAETNPTGDPTHAH